MRSLVAQGFHPLQGSFASAILCLLFVNPCARATVSTCDDATKLEIALEESLGEQTNDRNTPKIDPQAYVLDPSDSLRQNTEQHIDSSLRVFSDQKQIHAQVIVVPKADVPRYHRVAAKLVEGAKARRVILIFADNLSRFGFLFSDSLATELTRPVAETTLSLLSDTVSEPGKVDETVVKTLAAAVRPFYSTTAAITPKPATTPPKPATDNTETNPKSPAPKTPDTTATKSSPAEPKPTNATEPKPAANTPAPQPNKPAEPATPTPPRLEPIPDPIANLLPPPPPQPELAESKPFHELNAKPRTPHTRITAKDPSSLLAAITRRLDGPTGLILSSVGGVILLLLMGLIVLRFLRRSPRTQGRRRSSRTAADDESWLNPPLDTRQGTLGTARTIPASRPRSPGTPDKQTQTPTPPKPEPIPAPGSEFRFKTVMSENPPRPPQPMAFPPRTQPGAPTTPAPSTEGGGELDALFDRITGYLSRMKTAPQTDHSRLLVGLDILVLGLHKAIRGTTEMEDPQNPRPPEQPRP